MTDRSHLDETCGQIASRAASAVVARGRLASPALNAALLRRLSAGPGGAGAKDGAFLADPVFEAASLRFPRSSLCSPIWATISNQA